MSADQTPIILVGCGAVSQFQYGPALQALERTSVLRVAGLVDPSESARSQLKKTFPHAHSFSHLQDCSLDPSTLVVVASPPKWHAEQTIFALEQGAAVLCEKPMALTSAEAESMLDASRKTGALLAIGLFRRFFPASEVIKRILEEKPLGTLHSFSIQEGEKFGWGAASDSYFQRSITRGGVLYDIGVHVLDLLVWWFGEPTNFSYQDDAMGGIEANCLLEMSFSGGEHGRLRLSRDWQTRNSYIFYFDKGTVVYEVGHANKLNLWLDGTPFLLSGDLVEASIRHELEKRDTRTNLQSFIEQIANVVATMKGLDSLRVPGEEGIRSLRLLEACYGSRTLIDMPWLSERERSAAEALAAANV